MTLGEFGSQCVLVRVAVTKPMRRLEKWLREHLVEGDGFAVAPNLVGAGELLHDPDADLTEFVAGLLPWLISLGESVAQAPDFSGGF